MSGRLAIADRIADHPIRVVPAVSRIVDRHPTPDEREQALLASASALFAQLVPDAPSRDAAVRALVDLLATSVAERQLEHEPWISQDEAARRLGTDRQTLDGMLKRCPALAAGPVDVGLGKRHQYRWNPARLGEWASSYQEWRRAASPAGAKPHPTRRVAAKPRPVPAGVVNWNEVGRGEDAE